jgi:uncharacterized membrane protein YkoI
MTLLALVLTVGSTPAFALAAEKVQAKVAACLTEAEIREEVAAKRVVPQVTALRAARSSAGGDAVRARLCRGDAGLVYTITALKRDGKVVRVLVDAASGRVVAEN